MKRSTIVPHYLLLWRQCKRRELGETMVFALPVTIMSITMIIVVANRRPAT